jgi:hypothetical protein
MKLNTCPECGHYPTSHDKDGCMVGRGSPEACICKRVSVEALTDEILKKSSFLKV